MIIRRKVTTIDIGKLEDYFCNPMLESKYQYAINVILAKAAIINADLSDIYGRPIVRSTSSRIKSVDSIVRKLERKGYELSIESAVNNLNDIAGVRIICFFCDDIYKIAEAIKGEKDLCIIKEKDYVKKPKKSGYQSVHIIVSVPVTYNKEKELVRVEIQIRSCAMDYWAELDTQMCYKKNSTDIAIIEKEIRNYSDVMSEMDTKMLELRKKIEKMKS